MLAEYGFVTTPDCKACGNANKIANIQIVKMNLMARDNLLIVCCLELLKYHSSKFDEYFGASF